jgi:hypothetical protein
LEQKRVGCHCWVEALVAEKPIAKAIHDNKAKGG